MKTVQAQHREERMNDEELAYLYEEFIDQISSNQSRDLYRDVKRAEFCTKVGISTDTYTDCHSVEQNTREESDGEQ